MDKLADDMEPDACGTRVKQAPLCGLDLSGAATVLGAGCGPRWVPERISSGLVPGPTAVTPRQRLVPGLAVALSGTGSAREVAVGSPTHWIPPQTMPGT